ncbi:hypothetical protein [Pseudomonas aeruginosa]|uniref:hypothetical protein n=1 Tax=Pseudomonas aeruginosa TaxID=287 RepID=UPI001C611CFE|nr:hypothetical protein [Pseudomonas aeruginosa]MBW7075092.1 hypothetical protein [Pseudomonas aeruginosa]
MKQALTSTVVSLLISACLYFGHGSIHQFAFYVSAALNVLCWLLIFAGGIKGQGAANLLARPWLSIPTGALHVAALAVTDHPALAASSLLVQMACYALAYQAVRSAEQGGDL